jgi:hypothetical protein
MQDLDCVEISDAQIAEGDLATELPEAVQLLEKHFMGSLALHVDEDTPRPGAGQRFEVGENSNLVVSLPNCETFYLKANSAWDFVQAGFGRWDGSRLRAKRETYFLLEPVNSLAHWSIDPNPPETHEEHFGVEGAAGPETGDFCAALVFGPTPVALAIVKTGNYEKFHPPYEEQQPFLWITHDKHLPDERVDEIASAYLFELATSCQLTFRRSARLDDPHADFQEPADLLKRGERMRPLLAGSGIPPLIELFNQAAGASEPSYQILGFAKVVEYVASTVVRMESFEQLRIKLSAPNALRPDARFLDELKQTVERQQDWKQDKLSIQVAVVRCCDADELRRYAFPFCEKLHKLSLGSTDKDKEHALREFAGQLSAARNALSHAKPNYQASGDECPPEDYEHFAKLAWAAAELAVRWYAQSDPEMRYLPEMWSGGLRQGVPTATGPGPSGRG